MARITGWSYLIMFFLGIFAEFFVRTRLIVWDDPMLTLSNIQESDVLFKTGILAFVFIILLDVVITIAFYNILGNIDKFSAGLMATLRLVYVAIKGFSIAGLVLANEISFSAMDLPGVDFDNYAAQVMTFLKLHHHGFAVGLIFFGFHLIILSVLLLKLGEMKKFIVWTVLAAGIGYVANSVAGFLAVDSPMLMNVIIANFIIPMTFGELMLGLWLWTRQKNLPVSLDIGEAAISR